RGRLPVLGADDAPKPSSTAASAASMSPVASAAAPRSARGRVAVAPSLPANSMLTVRAAGPAEKEKTPWPRGPGGLLPVGSGFGQGPHEERGHLLAGDRFVGAEPVVLRRVAAPGDPGRSQGVDVAFEHRALVVDEAI